MGAQPDIREREKVATNYQSLTNSIYIQVPNLEWNTNDTKMKYN